MVCGCRVASFGLVVSWKGENNTWEGTERVGVSACYVVLGNAIYEATKFNAK